MKFIVVPVHHCWGCRKEFTDVNQFLEHVNKSMCLPSVNTDNAGSETAQPPSDSSTSIRCVDFEFSQLCVGGSTRKIVGN